MLERQLALFLLKDVLFNSKLLLDLLADRELLELEIKTLFHAKNVFVMLWYHFLDNEQDGVVESETVRKLFVAQIFWNLNILAS